MTDLQSLEADLTLSNREIYRLRAEVTRLTQERDLAFTELTETRRFWHAARATATQAEADRLLCQQGIAQVLDAILHVEGADAYLYLQEWAETLARLLVPTEQKANDQEDDSRSFGTHVRDAIATLRKKGPA